VHPSGNFNANEILDAMEREKVTNVFMVPTQWQAICDEPRLAQRRLSLRLIAWGAAPASDTLLGAMADRFPGVSTIATFGQTEMSPVTCVLEGRDAAHKLGSVGKPVSTVSVRIIDNLMRDVSDGQVGEIVYRGPSMMEGYWNDPQATAAAFAGGWFHSGDMVYRDEDGFLYVADRKKDMLISGGENIYCAEVENILSAHPDIAEIAIIGRPDPYWGEVPIAVVVTKTATDLTSADLAVWSASRLARYKQPKEVVIVDELPRNATGKVVKGELRKRYASVS
jgi:fatty-acyl-CoA synthase